MGEEREKEREEREREREREREGRERERFSSEINFQRGIEFFKGYDETLSKR